MCVFALLSCFRWPTTGSQRHMLFWKLCNRDFVVRVEDKEMYSIRTWIFIYLYFDVGTLITTHVTHKRSSSKQKIIINEINKFSLCYLSESQTSKRERPIKLCVDELFVETGTEYGALWARFIFPKQTKATRVLLHFVLPRFDSFVLFLQHRYHISFSHIHTTTEKKRENTFILWCITMAQNVVHEPLTTTMMTATNRLLNGT